jgi:hypothetical protein
MMNVSGLGQRIELGPWSVATVTFTWVQTEFVVGSGKR